MRTWSSSSPTCTPRSTFSGHGRFDLVFTGIGALCWLPDIGRWASVVADLLAPGGRLFLREGHPMLWALADPAASGAVLRVEHPYFEQPNPCAGMRAART